MSASSVRPYRQGDGEKLAALFEAYPFNDLRRYRLFNREKQVRYLSHKAEQCIQGGKVWVAEREGEITALAAARPLPWDSEIFGITMGQIPLLVYRPDRGGSRGELARLIGTLLESCRDDGYAHLNIKADADDFPLMQSLEANGFYLVDTIVTFIFIPKRHKVGHVKHLFQTRIYREEDCDAVMHVARVAYRNFIGRYHTDPHLPHERCDKLYELWAEKLLRGGLAERIIVAEKKGNVVGFLGYRKKSDILDSTGVTVTGGGLGGCLPEGAGAYAAILEAATHDALKRPYDMYDFETQINNVNIVRIYQKLNYEFARTKYTFHAWLG